MATGSSEMNVDIKGCNGTNEPTSKAVELPNYLIKIPKLRRESMFEPEPTTRTSLAYSYVEPSKNYMEEEPNKRAKIEGNSCSFNCINCLAKALNLEETKPNLYEKK